MKMGRFLKITRVKIADQGTYYCIAYNPYGKIRRQIRLVVQGKQFHKGLLIYCSRAHKYSRTSTNGATSTQRPLSSVPKVALVDRFDCILI